MVNLSDISRRVAEPFALLSNDAICVFVEDEKKNNETKLEKMMPATTRCGELARGVLK